MQSDSSVLDRPRPLSPPRVDRPPTDPAADAEVVARRRHPRRWAALLVVLLLAAPVLYSYSTYLTKPGSASTTERSIDWFRDHGGDSIVDRIETWWYTRSPPGSGAPNPDAFPALGGTVPARGATERLATSTAPPAPLAPIVTDHAIAGEGLWTPAGQTVHGAPTMFTTFLRPDPHNTSIVTALVSMDQHLLRTVSVPGTIEPGHGPWAWASGVPRRERNTLAATFNSGFRFRHIPGGYYSEGRTIDPLVDGQASLIVHRDGTVSIGEWGREGRLSGDVVSVRQNLKLIVDAGQPVSGLMTNVDGSWGASRNQLQWTWRSGIGVDAHGRLIYAAGDHMRLGDLASVLARAGAVRAMQLDIHYGQVTFSVTQPAGTGYGVSAAHLTGSMPKSPYRYLAADQRDFFAMFVR